MQDILVEGPYFEDFKVGEFLEEAPSITLTDGHATTHQMLFGDRTRLPLDHHLATEVTGSNRPLAHSIMAINNSPRLPEVSCDPLLIVWPIILSTIANSICVEREGF